MYFTSQCNLFNNKFQVLWLNAGDSVLCEMSEKLNTLNHPNMSIRVLGLNKLSVNKCSLDD